MKNTFKIGVIFSAISAFAVVSASGQQASPASKPAAPANSQQAPAAKPASKAPATKPAAKPADTLELKTDRDKASYALGMNLGEGLKKESENLDAAIVQRAMQDALSGKKTLLTEEEAKSAWTLFQVNMRKKQQEKQQELADNNKKTGDAFLAENKAKDGVVTLPSGLQYKILTPGTGPKPTATDSVECNYKGTLLDGTEFDSSYKRGQPATFPVTGVIKGWTEALQLMPVGSKWQLFIPPDQAYGPRGTGGGEIGPNATLVFEVELLSIKEPPKAAAPPATPATPGAEPSTTQPSKDPSKDSGKDPSK